MSWPRLGLALTAIGPSACGLAAPLDRAPKVAVSPRIPAVEAPRALAATPRQAIPAAAPSPPVIPRPDPIRAGRFARMFPFTSSRTDAGTGRGDLNLYIFDRATADVLTLPGINSPANEFFGSFSRTGRYLTYTTDEPGHGEIYRYDTVTRQIDTLPRLNTEAVALRAVSSDDGNLIAFSELVGDRPVMRLYDLRTGNRFVPAALRPPFESALVRDISPADRYVAYSAIKDGQSDIELYAIGTDQVVTPPFLNSPFTEIGPVFSPDAKRLVFTTDRDGSLDIFMADLTTGFLDRLPLANSPAEEGDPAFLPGGEEIIFRSSRTGRARLYIYNLRTHLLDTAPLPETGAFEEPD